MHISVVIPTLNEETHIRSTLECIQRQPGPFDILIVDGGSTDQTLNCIPSDVPVHRTPRGRARQMNQGATATTGEILLFLHADTHLPNHAFISIRESLSIPTVPGGCFRLAFDQKSLLLKGYAWCTRFPWSRIAFGDRAFFVRRSVFDQLGGFPDQPLFEDLDFFRAMNRLPGKLAYLPLSVTTSARRFERTGRLKQQVRNIFLWSLHNLGISAERLARYYPY